MLKNTCLRPRSWDSSPQIILFSQQKGPYYVNYIVDYKHFIDEMHNFK